MTAMTVTTARISADEFLTPEYPPGSELVDGVVHVNDATFRHQRLCGRIMFELQRWSEQGGGEAGWGGNWVLDQRNVFKPDVWWNAQAPEGARHDGPPDLAIEVRSPGTWRLDIGPKRDTYLAAGVRELWLVDHPASAVFGLSSECAQLDDALELGPGEQLTSPLLPGFTLAIDELFA